MAELRALSANMRISNADHGRVCSVSQVAPSVTAQTAVNFVDAIEKIYNNGACTARMSIVLDVVR